MLGTGKISPHGTEFDNLLFKAKRSDPEAQWRLAVTYAKGRGVPINMENAIKWYRAAAVNGQKDALYELYALCEASNPLVSKREPEAASWYEMAVECGRPGAAFSLAQIYEENHTTSKKPEDAEYAIKYYLQAAENGDRNGHVALFRLSQISFGNLSPRDLRVNVWRQTAAQHGHKEAQYSLATSYEQSRNLRDAVIWYEKAGTQDHSQALDCLNRLAALNNRDAKEALIRINAPRQLEQLQADYQLVMSAQEGKERERKQVTKTRGVKDDFTVQNAFFSLQGASDAYTPLTADELAAAQTQPKSVVLGNGSFGDVYAIQIASGNRSKTNKVFAMKVVPLPPPGRESIMKELQVLKRVQAASIIGFYGSFEHDQKLHLLLELAACALSKIVTQLPARYALQLLLETLQALEVLHANGVIHRDLKPDNILVGSDGHARVGDFGVAKVHQTLGHTTQVTDGANTGGIVGTIEYMAPEAFGDEACTTAADIYALGLIAYTLAKKALLYPGKTPAQIMGIRLGQNQARSEKEILKSSLPANTLPAFSIVIARSCDRTPAKRWTAQNAHVYLKKEATQTPVLKEDIAQVVTAVKAAIPEPQRVFYPAYF